MEEVLKKPGLNSKPAEFIKLVNSGFKFGMYLLLKLPAAFFSGVRVKSMSEERCIVAVPFKWFSQNPFQSTYFACLSMAAEMSTGVLAMAHTYKSDPGISMLVVNIEGDFFKKATGVTLFTCNDGLEIKKAVEESLISGDGKTLQTTSIGTNEHGEKVAEFRVTWSFKARSKS